MSPRASQDLRSPSLIMAPGGEERKKVRSAGNKRIVEINGSSGPRFNLIKHLSSMHSMAA